MTNALLGHFPVRDFLTREVKNYPSPKGDMLKARNQNAARLAHCGHARIMGRKSRDCSASVERATNPIAERSWQASGIGSRYFAGGR